MRWSPLCRNISRYITAPRFSINSNRQLSVCLHHCNAPRVCIIGSGPAGFYTAQYVLKKHATACVDLFEKLPVPFGLVRYGVAPDHPEVKNATSSFEQTAKNDRFSFFGNVDVGTDVKVNELREIYDAVVLAYGADDDKKLNIPGEDTPGVLAARAFVGWYNGLPAHADLHPHLDCDTAAVIGQGNVALDVARMLLAPREMLQSTDICDYALDALSHSQIRKVYLIGRRGPLQVAFTIKELREMINLPDCHPTFDANDFRSVYETLGQVPRPRRRLVELMCKTALNPPDNSHATNDWELVFNASPVQVFCKPATLRVSSIRLEHNELVTQPDGSVSAVASGEHRELECGLVLRSIGYRSVRVDDGVPFDRKMGVIPNIDGRVVREPKSLEIVPGLYCSGWVKHGPVGVIATTMTEAFATAQRIIEDLNDGKLPDQNVYTSTKDVNKLLRSRGVQYVSYKQYQEIDASETRRGGELGKPREKCTSIPQMLDTAFKCTR